MTELEELERSIFLRAIELATPEEVSKFLDNACAEDPSLRRRVESLLLANQDHGDLFDQSDNQTASGRSTFDHQIGTSIGPYKLREKIGEGGFGQVYIAEQKQPVSRKVALKIIKPGMDSKDVIARFEAERQALAMMDHPNVAKVLDAGATELGRPYFVMELVHGTSITKFCDAQKLTNRQRLELFVDVCRAVQHAHQKGIIHRDLKPTNVMVTMADHRAVVKVIDFGVAKALHHALTDKSIYTGYGQLIGTPMYMSPEQAQMSSLDVDSRSDVYSLGVLLYELLTGAAPFDKETFKQADFDEVRRIIREDDPPRPSDRVSTLNAELQSTVSDQRMVNRQALCQSLRGDLDWIVMKTLQKDRTRRYETANALAADVQRYLDDETVLACPPSTMYRLRKFARRNKVNLAFASLAILVVVAGVIGLAASNYMLTQRGNETLAALKKSDENFQLAQNNLELANQNLDLAKTNEENSRREAAIAKAVNEFVNDDLLGKADPHAEPNRDLKVSEVLDRAIDSLDGRFMENALVEAEIRTTIYRALLNLGRIDEAQQQLIAIREIYRSELTEDDRKVLDIELALAWILHERGHYRQCLDELMPISVAIQQRFGINDPLSLTAMSQRADLLRHLGEFDESEKLYRKVISGSETDEETFHQNHGLALVLLDRGKAVEAEKIFRDLLARLIDKRGAKGPDTIKTRTSLADSLVMQGRYKEAEEILFDVLEDTKNIFGIEHPRFLEVLNALAVSIAKQGRINEAEQMLKDSIERLQEARGKENPRLLAAKYDLANIMILLGQYEKAENLCRELHATCDRILGSDDRLTIRVQMTLGMALWKRRRVVEAEPLVREALRIQYRVLGVDHPDTLRGMDALAKVCLDLDQFEEAENLSRRALDGASKLYGEDHSLTLDGRIGLANVLLRQGHDHDAAKLFRDVLAVQERELKRDHPRTLDTMNSLAVLFWRAKQLDKSIPLFERLVRAYKAELGEDHPGTLLIVANLGVNYKDAGKLDEAVRLLENAHRAAKTYPHLLFATQQLIATYVEKDDLERASALVPDYLKLIRGKLPKTMLASHLAALGHHYYLQIDAFAEAEIVLKESLAIREKTIPNDWRTFNVKSWIGEALLGQQKYREAEPLLLKGYQGMANRETSIPAGGKKFLTDSVERLVKLYHAWHKKEPNDGYDQKAVEWQQNLEELNQHIETDNSK